VPGLLIAIRLTACLKVAGDYVPPLRFLGILLGAETPSNESYDYYRRLLELDHSGAHSLAIRYCDEHGLEATFSDVMTPAIVIMGDDFDHGNINERNLETGVETTRQLIVDLGDLSTGRGRLRAGELLASALLLRSTISVCSWCWSCYGRTVELQPL